MVAFATTDLPSSVNSVEKLSVWASIILNELHPAMTAVEAVDYLERVATANTYQITATDPPTWRHIARLSIPVAATWRGSGKIWTHVQDLSSNVIPLSYKS